MDHLKHWIWRNYGNRLTGFETDPEKVAGHFRRTYEPNPRVIEHMRSRPKHVRILFNEAAVVRFEWSRWQRFRCWLRGVLR